MPFEFLSPSYQCQSTEGDIRWLLLTIWHFITAQFIFCHPHQPSLQCTTCYRLSLFGWQTYAGLAIFCRLSECSTDSFRLLLSCWWRFCSPGCMILGFSAWCIVIHYWNFQLHYIRQELVVLVINFEVRWVGSVFCVCICSCYYTSRNLFQPQVGNAIEFGRWSTWGTNRSAAYCS